MGNNETEKQCIKECFCCKKDKEVSSICASEADAIKVRNTDCDIYVKRKFVCKDCNHLEKRE